jgi:hypothetical protein
MCHVVTSPLTERITHINYTPKHQTGLGWYHHINYPTNGEFSTGLFFTKLTLYLLVRSHVVETPCATRVRGRDTFEPYLTVDMRSTTPLFLNNRLHWPRSHIIGIIIPLYIYIPLLALPIVQDVYTFYFCKVVFFSKLLTIVRSSRMCNLVESTHGLQCSKNIHYNTVTTSK